MPDPYHVIKNMKNALTEGHMFSFGAKTVKKIKLVHRHPTFDISRVKQLLEFDKKHDLKLAPYLRDNVIDPSHFEKMKVDLAFKLFHPDVPADINYLIEKGVLNPHYSTASWFIKTTPKWFHLMSGRNFLSAICQQCPKIYYYYYYYYY
jgi:hypothetical protein